MKSLISRNLVCSVSLYLNPFTLGLLVSYAYLLPLRCHFAPAIRVPLALSSVRYNRTKLPESGDLFGNITEFGVAEEHLSPQGEGDLPPPLTK